MAKSVVSRVLQELQPSRLLPSLTAGLIGGVIIVIVEISLAALIFSGELSKHVASGIGLHLLGTTVIGIVCALVSSFPGTVAVVQDSSAAILALVAAAILAGIPAGAAPESEFVTVVAGIITSSLATGLFFLLLGVFKLGGLVRYIPYPVIGGFLAGTGWMLVQGGIGMMTDASLSLAELSNLLSSDIVVRWLPGLAFAVLLLIVLRRFSHFLILPSMMLGAIGLFYFVAWVAGLSPTELGDQRWLMGPFPEGGLWQPLTFADLSRVHWPAIFQQAGDIGTVMILSVLTLLLNASGIELTARQDMDLNHELRAAGVGNLLAALGGSPPGSHTLSLSALGYRMGANSRVVGLTAAALCGSMLFFGAPILSFFPKVVLGGTLLFLGLAFLVEWLYDGWFKLSKRDYAVVVIILLAINLLGLLEGVGVGLMLAVILFVIDYSGVSVVKHTLSGATYRSNVERPRLFAQLLRKKGEWLYVLQLQGFIFFGTANRLFDQVRQRLAAPDLPHPQYILFDFQGVSGLDASAVLSFNKIKQLAQTEKLILVFTGLTPKARRRLERGVFYGKDADVWRTFADLDHGVEWCEEQMIQVFEKAGLTTKPKWTKHQLQRSRSHLGQADRFLDWLAQDTQDKGEDEHDAGATDIKRVLDYMERMEAHAGEYLIRQGETPKRLYFVEEGQVTVQLEAPVGDAVRLRTIGAGTVVGEMGLYSGTMTSASVVADRSSVLFCLSAENLERMEKEAPETAAVFHRFIIQLLSDRVLSTTDTLHALMK